MPPAPTTPDRADALSALDRVRDPVSGKGLAEAGLVRGLVVGPGRAGFMLEVEAPRAALYGPVRDAAEAALAALPGVTEARVVMTAEAPPVPSRSAAPRQARLSPAAADGGRAPAPRADSRPDQVRKVVCVASGKGGVGKSTVAANLACALAAQGLATGLLDADVHGPSVPVLLGIKGPPEIGEDRRIVPVPAHGLLAMSTGLLVDAERAMAWRGPMASQALKQMLRETRWGEPAAPLDVLIVDLPPGTGDVHLTFVQQTLVDGAVIVATPGELALADVRRALALFQTVSVPVLGLVENMAYFPDPATGAPIPIFGEGQVRAEADRLGLAVLAEIPIDMAVRRGGDRGAPLRATDPRAASSLAFDALATRVREAVGLGA